MLRVKPMPGESTRFWVESNSLQCIKCDTLFNKRLHPELRVGDVCPKCRRKLSQELRDGDHDVTQEDACDKLGKLDIRFHVVDLDSYNSVGECGCEYFQFSLAQKLASMSPQQRVESQDKFRCHHIKAARDFALDLALHLHRHEQKPEPKKGGRIYHLR